VMRHTDPGMRSLCAPMFGRNRLYGAHSYSVLKVTLYGVRERAKHASKGEGGTKTLQRSNASLWRAGTKVVRMQAVASS